MKNFVDFMKSMANDKINSIIDEVCSDISSQVTSDKPIEAVIIKASLKLNIAFLEEYHNWLHTP